MSIALRFDHVIVTFDGGCFGQPPRLRFAEFVDHSLDTYLALSAGVTNDAHGRTLLRRTLAGVS